MIDAIVVSCQPTTQQQHDSGVTCCLSTWAMNQIDKRRHAFLWAGTSTVAASKCKVAWPIVCRLTYLGGLGVPDLRFSGFTLRLHWEWLVRTSP
jgi:hypothetical protein